MARSWRSLIADETRATSMMKPKWPEDAMEHVATLNAEITQLRAELEQERELADRLGDAVRAADFVIKSARPDSGWLVAYKDNIAAAYTRRNK